MKGKLQQKKAFSLIEILVAASLVLSMALCISRSISYVFFWEHKNRKSLEFHFSLHNLSEQLQLPGAASNKIKLVESWVAQQNDKLPEYRVSYRDFSQVNKVAILWQQQSAVIHWPN